MKRRRAASDGNQMVHVPVILLGYSAPMRLTVLRKILQLLLPGLWLQATASASDTPPEFSLLWPVDCALGDTCWIARYPDKYTDKTATDYTCGFRTQEGHDGTDIAVSDLSALDTSIAVRAAADGVVWRVRDGVKDQILKPGDEDTVSKIGCGNVVIMQHPGGWQTNYCHLKNGSILVEPGQPITKGKRIGAVGVSGLTEFPHLHFMVRRKIDGTMVSVDPFDGQPLTETCHTEKNDDGGLWDTPVAYQKTALMPPLVTERRAERTEIWQLQPSSLSANARVLYFQTRGFHVKEGDVWTLQLTAPDGTLFRNRKETQSRSRQRITIALGIPRPSGGFATGVWRATTSLERGNQEIDVQSTSFSLVTE